MLTAQKMLEKEAEESTGRGYDERDREKSGGGKDPLTAMSPLKRGLCAAKPRSRCRRYGEAIGPGFLEGLAREAYLRGPARGI